MKKRLLLVLSILAVLALLGFVGPSAADDRDCFSGSLHHSGEGMRYWYEAPDRFMTITDTPYKELGCKGCHVQGCNTCHLDNSGNGLAPTPTKRPAPGRPASSVTPGKKRRSNMMR